MQNSEAMEREGLHHCEKKFSAPYFYSGPALAPRWIGIEFKSNVLLIPFPLPQITCSVEVSYSSPSLFSLGQPVSVVPAKYITVKQRCK